MYTLVQWFLALCRAEGTAQMMMSMSLSMILCQI